MIATETAEFQCGALWQTGASTGMGLATAKCFVEEGMDHVFITGRGKDALDAAAAEIGRNVTGVQGDVATLNDLDRLYEAVKSRYRQIDVIFANAGVSQIATLGRVDEKFFHLHFDANVKGLFLTVQKGLLLMNDGGTIILNASIATIKGFPGMRLQRHESSRLVIRAHLDERTPRAPHSRERDQPRPYRYSDF